MRTFVNQYTSYGRVQRWQYTGGCEFLCSSHRGKTEWHHPISSDITVGLYLCESHHSLILGRAKRYSGELLLDETVMQMRERLVKQIEDKVLSSGYQLADIDKK